VVAVDGAACAVWRHEAVGGALRLDVEPFGRPSREVRAGVAAEAERLASFLGLEPGGPRWATP
jgi:hypothetical protein